MPAACLRGAGETASLLHALMRQAMEMAEEVAAVDHAVACDRAYIAKAAVRGGAAALGPGGSHSAGKGPADVSMADADQLEGPTEMAS